MKTKKMTRFSFSKKNCYINLPKSWSDCSDEDKLRIFKVMRLNKNVNQCLTLIIVALLDIRIVDKLPKGWLVKPRRWFSRRHLLTSSDFTFMISKIKWIEDIPSFPINIKQIGKFSAVNSELKGVSFITFLTCDTLYQAFIKSDNWEYIRRMAKFLYSYKNKDIKLNDDQAYSIFYWWYSLKCYYNKKFPFLFASAPEGASSDEVESSVNAQIRILTGGDITKEKEIYEHDAYRAITELNEKAREIYESNKKLKK